MAERFAVDTEARADLGVTVYRLEDRESGLQATVVPAWGSTLLSLQAPIRGRPLEFMLMAPPEEIRRAPSSYGTPVLFPFPNRIRHARFTFAGRTYHLPVNHSHGHHIHGLVRDLPWRVTATATQGSASLTTEIAHTDHPVFAECYPFPFTLALIFSLRGPRLEITADVHNYGEHGMPMGFGLHPYFALPIVPEGRRQDCLIQIPAGHQWRLDDELLPTGEVIPVPPERDFRQLRPLDEVYLDDVYTRLERLEDGSSLCRLVDPQASAQVAVRADSQFREWVVYAPPHRPTLCFEPYTCPTDAPNLQERGLDAGLIVVPPGGHWTGTVWFEVGPATL